jgi:hypothetical protein
VVRPRDHWERDAFKAGAWTSIPPGVLLGGIVVGAIGVAATFLGIGLCYFVVTVYRFFNAGVSGDGSPATSCA